MNLRTYVASFEQVQKVVRRSADSYRMQAICIADDGLEALSNIFAKG